jgi:uncharacterized cupin superfamily protein
MSEQTPNQGVVHQDEVKPYDTDHPRYRARRLLLGRTAGGRQLGCSLWELPSGARSTPYHWHAANEEAIYVLEGQGVLRLDGREHAIRAGHYAALPAGPEGAHQVINTSQAPLRYLCFSTLKEPEVAFYPDSDKMGVMMGWASPLPRVTRLVPGSAQAGYYDGEE